MIHADREQFLTLIDRTASITGFFAPLVEKDYYLTVLLSRIHELSEDLIFKGGTCLNKIYYSYYRLSEDLDFSIRLPNVQAMRGQRRKCMRPIKEGLEDFVGSFGLAVDTTQVPGRNESKQYVYYLVYDSVTTLSPQTIKLEIGLRCNPLMATEKKPVQHKFLHSFTDEPLFDGGIVQCLALKEIVAEKMRAAATRKIIAPRDFYDLDFIMRQGFKLKDAKLFELFKKKLQEDQLTHDDIDMTPYRLNLGRSLDELASMRSRIEEELFDVLTPEEQQNFHLDQALKRINKAMKE